MGQSAIPHIRFNLIRQKPIFQRPLLPLIPYLSALLNPILPFTTFPPTTRSLLRSSAVVRHCLGLGKSEMDHIKEPDLEWIRSQRLDERSRGLFALYAQGNLDGWVGKEGVMTRECLGGEEGGRVRTLHGVPHAFCLSKAIWSLALIR